MHFLRITSALLICLVAVSSADGNNDFVGGRKVRVSNQKVNFFTASEICRSYGLQLLEIHNSEENKQANDLLNKYDLDVAWFDLNDLGTHDTYVWLTTGKRAVNMYWNDAAFDLQGQYQDCMSIIKIRGSSEVKNWIDRVCKEKHFFICQETVRNCECDPNPDVSAVFWK